MVEEETVRASHSQPAASLSTAYYLLHAFLNRGALRTAYSFARQLPTLIALFMIRTYQYTLARLLPSACRFWPSCSHYSYEAISRYGVWRGGWMMVRRLARCHPFSPGGYDPVH